MDQKSEQKKGCLDVKGLADYLGVSLMTAYDLCRRKDFPAVRVSPRRIIIPMDGLIAWLASNAGV